MKKYDAKTATVFDFSATVKALTECMETVYSNATSWIDHFPKEALLREFRTIGVLTPRQVGKTKFITQEIINDPEAIIIVKGIDLKKHMLNPNTYHHVEMTSSVLASISDRVFTDHQLKVEMAKPEAERTWSKFTKIYVDDATYVFEKVDRKKFYVWLASLNIETPTIILIG